MGVHGLWELLAPVGRRVSVENLTGKRLAIDASIWMVQFMKAMRDENGEMVRNAHLIGFFRRICKLLFLRTKPVFVFDGATPALKRRTVLARRRQRENAQAKIRKTAERLLLNHLKQVNLKRLAEDLKNQRQDDVGKGKKIVVGEVDNADNYSQRTEFKPASDSQEKLDEMLAASLAAEDNWTCVGDESASASGVFLEEENNEDEEQEELLLPTIQGDIDLNVISSLPPSMHLDLLAQMRERLMAENRQKYQKVKKVPEKFSELQIQSYLKTVAFRREIDEVQKSAGTRGVDGVRTSKIASETSREFIFSSSFAGNREVLASKKMEKTLNNKDEAPSELHSVPTMAFRESALSNNGSGGGLNETEEVLHANSNTYLKERCSRTMGIRMTRDLQRNLDMMKEMEQEKSDAVATGQFDGSFITRSLITGSLQPNNSQMDANSNNKNAMDHSLGFTEPAKSADKTSFQISFDSCFEEDCHDGDDEIFNNLVARKPLVVTEVDNLGFSEPFSASDFGSDWKEWTIDGSTDNKNVGEAQTKCEALPLEGTINDGSEVEWEDGVSDVAQDAAFHLVEHRKAASRGVLEEEAQLQEAIKRSLQNVQGAKLDYISPNTVETHSSNEVAHLSPDKIEVPQSGLFSEKVQNEIEFSCESVDAGSHGIAGEGSILTTAVTAGNHSAMLAEPVDECCECDGQPTSNYNPMEDVSSIGGNADHNISAFRTSPSLENQEADLGVNLVDYTLASVKSAPVLSDSMDDPSAPLGVLPSQGSSVNTDSNIGFLEGTTVHLYKADKMNKSEVHELNVAQREGLEASLVDELSVLNKERLNLGNEQKKLERNAESVSGEMFAECQELLQMFGLPYIIAPMEAEAQCAFLEQAGLVDGVVTDDSDVFLFGAQSVYKNIFDNRKYVETYFMKDIEHELGLSREKLIRMAMLLGSDYTEGISGIGIVNAIEVINAFPEDDGLHKFRQWIESPDPTIFDKKKGPIVNKKPSTLDKKGRMQKKKGFKKHGNDVSCSASALDQQDDSDHNDEGTVDHVLALKQIFMDKHRNVSKNWHVPSSFPSDAVISAYTSPTLDTSTEPFSHGRVDHPVLRRLCLEKFGWSYQKTDELLLPVLKEYNKKETQLRLEAFYSFNEKFAKIRSKRIKKAVKGITGKNSPKDVLQRVSRSNRSEDLSDTDKPAEAEYSVEDGSTSNGVSPLEGTSSKKVSSKRKAGKESASTEEVNIETEKVNIESPVSAEDLGNASKASPVIRRGRQRVSGTGGLSRKRSKLSDYSEQGDVEGSIEKSPRTDIHKKPEKIRRLTRNRNSVNYPSDDVDVDEVDKFAKQIEEECAEKAQVNQQCTPCPRDVGPLDIDQNGTPLTVDVSGDYLRMGGGFCIDEGE
uniref:DNA repair protein UVH3 n=1 Tax=Kalanchoe fedtschenkoi TaxID=63787 RepID=A0A7N0UPT8_KALFE